MAVPICALLHAFVLRWPSDMGSRCMAPYDRFLCFCGAPTAGYGGVKKHRRQMHLILRANDHLMHLLGRRAAVLKAQEVTAKKENSGASIRIYITTERFRAPRGQIQTKQKLNYRQASSQRTVTTEKQYQCHGEPYHTAPQHAPLVRRGAPSSSAPLGGARPPRASQSRCASDAWEPPLPHPPRSTSHRSRSHRRRRDRLLLREHASPSTRRASL